MLNELTLLCLLLLVIAHSFLIRGCFKINETIPNSTNTISHHFDNVSTLLNELCDIIADMTGGGSSQGSVNPHTGSSLPEMLSTILMNRFAMPQEHGNPLKEEWTIHENDSPPTLETENQLD